jgi:hypothetical protein
VIAISSGAPDAAATNQPSTAATTETTTPITDGRVVKP